jgi:DNA-binding beta-propeller fold protein YncE
MICRMLTPRVPSIALSVLVLALCGRTASAQLVVSANDGKLRLVDGVNTTITNPPPDTITVIDLAGAQAKIVGEVQAPASVIGPPQSVAIAPDESIALVTASTKLDPADAGKTAYDDKLTVIDLKSTPPKVIATLQAGTGASGVSINRAGTLALVANRYEGSLSIFTISGKTVTPAGKVSLNAPESQPSGVAFTRDGRMALVTRNNDSVISLLTIDGTKVEYAKRDIGANLKPYGIEVAPAGDVALVASIGVGASGGADVVSVIDLAQTPPRVVDHASVGPLAEGIAISPDGRYAAVTIINGTNSAKASPLFKDFGLVRILALNNKKLTPIAEAKTGRWCQGVAWDASSRRVLVQCMIEREIQTFTFDGKTLTAGAPIKVNGGPAGIRTAQR